MDIRCNNCFNLYDSEFEMCPYCGYSKGDPAQEPYFLVPGTVLAGRYTIGKAVGFGGFGITYKSWDNQLESVVAIKEYYPSGIVNRPPGTSELILFSGEKRKEFEFGLSRFIEEARNTTKFNSCENIVNVYEYFEENNTAYFVMEFLDGVNLSEYLSMNGGKLPLETSLDIIFKICNALKYVHEAGFIHRDISPDNIFMCKNGAVKLIDFGAARFSSEEEKSFTIILKPGFAPPEQYEQVSDQGPKTDVYALGATLYYIMTGVKPDESSNRKIQDIVEEPNKIDSSIPQYINDTILKAMAMEPSLRFESVDDFEKSLRKQIKVTSLKKEKQTRKRKRLAGIMSLAAVLVVIATIFGANVKKKSEVIKLDAANITIWYTASEGDAIDEAYKKVIAEFAEVEEHKDVKITAKCFPAGRYDYELSLAINSGKTPSLFMSTNLDDTSLEKTADIKTILFPENQGKIYFLINSFLTGGVKDCYYLDDYEKLFPTHRQIPVSFNLPVLYINTSKSSAKDIKSVSSYKDIAQYIENGETVLVSPLLIDFFKNQFGAPKTATFTEGTVDDFTQGEYSFFLGDTSAYFNVRKMLSDGTGIPKVAEIKMKNLPCEFNTLWSVGTQEKNEKAAACRLLSFLLTANAQSRIYGRSNSEKALPINKDALAAIAETYEDLRFIDHSVKNSTVD